MLAAKQLIYKHFFELENHRPIGRFSLAPAESWVTVLWSFGFVDLCIRPWVKIVCYGNSASRGANEAIIVRFCLGDIFDQESCFSTRLQISWVDHHIPTIIFGIWEHILNPISVTEALNRPKKTPKKFKFIFIILYKCKSNLT